MLRSDAGYSKYHFVSQLKVEFFQKRCFHISYCPARNVLRHRAREASVNIALIVYMVLVSLYSIDRFSIECCKTNTKVITLANHK